MIRNEKYTHLGKRDDIMRSKKQEELINTFLMSAENEAFPLYLEIIDCLEEFGYYPHKLKSNITFKHDSHNKQIAKMGIKNNKERSAFFALRFSACRGYSARFADIVRQYVTRYPARSARCTDGVCNYCAGDPDTHVYIYESPDGRTVKHCGAYAVEITNIAAGDMAEIKNLIAEEHAYLMKHQAGVDIDSIDAD